MPASGHDLRLELGAAPRARLVTHDNTPDDSMASFLCSRERQPDDRPPVRVCFPPATTA